jgi:hypothetical protein
VLVTRRDLAWIAAGGLIGGLGARSLLRPARARTLPADATFDVLRGKSRIGQHAVTFAPVRNGFRAVTELDLTVKLAFVTLLDLRHHSEELWQDGRLVELRSTTQDGSDRFEVRAEAVPEGIRCDSPAGSIFAPADMRTSNGIWSIETMSQAELIDAQNGGIIGMVAEDAGQDAVKTAGGARQADKYRVVTPSVAGDLWYVGAELIKARLEVRGDVIEYRRVA